MAQAAVEKASGTREKGSRHPQSGVTDLSDKGALSEKRGMDTYARILRAAEKLFAEGGFDGVTVRQISLEAGTPLASINHHFGNKEGLYRAIFDLHSQVISEQRLVGIEIALMEPDLDKRLVLLVQALAVPLLRLRARDTGAYYSSMLAREATDPRGIHRHIIEELYDGVSLRMIEELAVCLPGRSRDQIHWAYHSMLGAVIFIMADNGRISRLSGGSCDPNNDRVTTQNLVPFLANGFRGLPVTQPVGGSAAEA